MNAARTAAVLVRLRWRRVRNRLSAPKKAAPGAARTATASRGRAAWVTFLLGVYLPLFALFRVKQMLELMLKHATGDATTVLAGPAAATVGPAVSAELGIVVVAVLLMSMASRELTSTEWDLEWLVTLPVPRRTLLGVRILERTLVNPPGLVLLLPFATAIAWRSDLGPWSPLWGVACALPLLAVIGAPWVTLEGALRMRLSPPRLRNAQALVTVLTFVAYFVAASPLAGSMKIVDRLGGALGPAWAWTPAGLAFRALTANDVASGALAFAWLLGEAAVIAALSLAVIQHLVRHGVVTTGGREGGGRAVARPAARGWAPAWLTPVQRRELRLLGRDRNFLVQTLLMPVFIVGMQIYFGTRHLSFASVDPTNAVAAGFGVAAYALMFSAFQVLNAEGQALWILFTLPARIERVLLDKARLWGGLALVYPLTVVVLLLATRGPTPRVLGLSFVALVGVPIFATIASAFGVLAWDPTWATMQQRRLRPAFVYLYMALAGMYTFALYASGTRQRVVLMILTGFVALALWQKARDHLPYLLDTTAAPPARVSIADGLIAALVFFVAQAVVALAVGSDHPDVAALVYKSFIWGGAITFATVRFVHWRTHAKGVPTYLGPRPLRAVALGLGGAVVAAVVGVAYLMVVHHFGWFPAVPQSEVRVAAGILAPLAIVAAPIFEEYIFRGLLFGGLARSVSPALATFASAAIFAMVHPPLAAVPVFFMALVAATVYSRAGILLGPVLVHAGYNAAVVAAQAWFGS